MAKTAMMTDTPNVWDVVEANLAIPQNYVLLYGKPGTGKSYAASTMSWEGKPENMFTVTLNEGSTEAEFRGHHVPVGDHFEWMHGLMSEAWVRSHVELTRFVVNEVDRSELEVLSFLHAALDDPTSPNTRLTLPNQERTTITPGPYFQCVLTMNGVPEDLPDAVVDRLVCIEIDRPHPDAFLQVAERYRAAAEADVDQAINEGGRISLRGWIKLSRLVADGMDEEFAAYSVFRDRYREYLTSIATAQSPIGKYKPAGEINNGEYNSAFSPWEDFGNLPDERHAGWCGWCFTSTCDGSSASCKPMQFESAEEHQAFCDYYGLPGDESLGENEERVRDYSLKHRTYTSYLTAESFPARI